MEKKEKKKIIKKIHQKLTSILLINQGNTRCFEWVV